LQLSYIWTKQGIRWFKDASNYTGYHKNLADKITPYLNKEDTLCDVGCGLGCLDIFLASKVSQITAIDSNAEVIKELKKSVREKDIHNINAVCADAENASAAHDIFLMSFFGHCDEIKKYFKYCRKKLIYITNLSNKSNFYPKIYRSIDKPSISIIKKVLNEEQISYELFTDSIEFGQPFRSEEDARDFVLHNAPDAKLDEVEQFLKNRAQNTGRRDFPIYIPNKKQIEIFIISF
jgi:SAM-dependent methyltransferase